MAGIPFALQLYSVRDYLERDAAAALMRVKAAGYDFVELAGTAGLEPARFKALIEAARLRAVSAHVPAELLEGGLDAAIGGARLFGVDHLVVPWIEPSAERAVWEARARQLDAWGAALRAAGIRLAYHNHDHEFRDAGGALPFDLLFDLAAPEHLAVQLDIGWAAYAGADVEALFARYAGRMPTVHCKQFGRDPDGTPYTSELAQGIVAYPPIVRAALAHGTQWCIVEQDESRGDSLESAAANAAYMRMLTR